MGTEAERQDTRKAMAFDIFTALDENEKAGKETYTASEIKQMITAYIITANQK